MMWNDEVDVVCAGTGAGALAIAVTSVDAGLDVFVARTRAAGPVELTQPLFERLHPWLDADVDDPETMEYFTALAGDMGPLRATPGDAEVSIRVASLPTPVDPMRRIEPFFGARLRDWTTRCAVSPYGFLHSRVAGLDTTTMRTRGGETIEVAVLGSFEPCAEKDARTALTEWLDFQSRDRGIQAWDSSPLQRLVFEEGEVVGAVFATPDGPFAVRARHGVAVATGALPVEPAAPSSRIGDHGTLHVCVVGQSASRFGRVELLSTEPGALRTRFPYCATNRQLRDALHESKLRGLAGRRRREVHRYPPPGQ